MAVKILMVCLGNICRSPLAEGILRNKLPEGFIVDSAGTGGWHSGEQPDKRSLLTAKNRGIDISTQRARKFQKSDFEKFDLIYAMDNQNYADLVALAPTKEAKAKIHLILEEIFPNQQVDVPDPYYGNLTDFENVFDLLDEVCIEIAKKIKRFVI